MDKQEHVEHEVPEGVDEMTLEAHWHDLVQLIESAATMRPDGAGICVNGLQLFVAGAIAVLNIQAAHAESGFAAYHAAMVRLRAEVDELAGVKPWPMQKPH